MREKEAFLGFLALFESLQARGLSLSLTGPLLPRRRQVALGDLFFRSLRLAFCLFWVLEEDALSPNLEGAGPETERNIEFWGEGCDRGSE